ncbi:MAG: 16S rRNA (adenine(1518)-N(6)/adenine(1519)-N(6))-dimethyltransferase RsmA [Mycoplasmatales bacterium]
MENFKTKKSLGQNFLQDQNIINKIVTTANLSKNINVLEIGPGLGAITTLLIAQANQVLSVEIDQRLIEHLNKQYSQNNNFTLLNKDFLLTTKEDFSPILNKKIKMVANLPYYITTPIIIKVLLEYEFIEEIYIMIQKEVAQRFTSAYKNKSYGSISVFLQSIADVKYEFTVKNTAFSPAPKIDSAIISLKRNNKFLEKVDFLQYEQFLKACFKQKRKLLSNNLATSYKIDKNLIIEFLLDLNYVKTIRPEEILVTEYLILFQKFKEKFIIREDFE